MHCLAPMPFTSISRSPPAIQEGRSLMWRQALWRGYFRSLAPVQLTEATAASGSGSRCAIGTATRSRSAARTSGAPISRAPHPLLITLSSSMISCLDGSRSLRIRSITGRISVTRSPPAAAVGAVAVDGDLGSRASSAPARSRRLASSVSFPGGNPAVQGGKEPPLLDEFLPVDTQSWAKTEWTASTSRRPKITVVPD